MVARIIELICIVLLLSTMTQNLWFQNAKTLTPTLTSVTHPTLIVLHDDDVSNLWTQTAPSTTTLHANNIAHCRFYTWTACCCCTHFLLPLVHPTIWGFCVTQSCNAFQLMLWGSEMKRKNFFLLAILLLLGFGLLEVFEVVALLLL